MTIARILAGRAPVPIVQGCRQAGGRTKRILPILKRLRVDERHGGAYVDARAFLAHPQRLVDAG